MNPDGLVEAFGETATHKWLSGPSYDVDDVLDVDASTFTEDSVKVFPSIPSQKELVRFSGREDAPSIKFTVKSTLDVQAAREGLADEFMFNDKHYKVVEVIPDEHRISGPPKKSVFLVSRPGTDGF